MKVKSGSEVTQSCLTLSDPMDCSLPESSIHGIFQARVLEWGAIAFSRRSHYMESKELVFESWFIPDCFHLLPLGKSSDVNSFVFETDKSL